MITALLYNIMNIFGLYLAAVLAAICRILELRGNNTSRRRENISAAAFLLLFSSKMLADATLLRYTVTYYISQMSAQRKNIFWREEYAGFKTDRQNAQKA